jgi:RNA polymerase sigma-70 factor (ECF subfamily)
VTADQRYLHEPVDQTTPETLYERRWAQTVMGVVLDRLAAETDERRFEVLKGYLLDEKGELSYEEASAQLRLSVPAITSAIHRMRARFRALLFQEVANTVNGAEEVEQELRHLVAAL